MKQEYTDKLLKYQQNEFELFLREKGVLDAKQFLHASLLYLNYAVITEKLYRDAGEKNIVESKKNPFYNTVEIMGWSYNAHTILNKFTMEWISHISNSLDCILQYINSALNLGWKHKEVTIERIRNKVDTFDSIKNAINDFWEDSIVAYIRSVYNYSKHTMDLYGGSSFTDTLTGLRDIRIPDFRFRKEVHTTKSITELMDYYETFIQKYVEVLDCVKQELMKRTPVEQRLHIGQVIIDGHILGEKQLDEDIILNAEFADDGKHIKRFWIEKDISCDVEIMMLHNKTIGQHMGGISKIELIRDGNIVGRLKSDITNIENSTLQYLKYEYEEVK